MSARPGTAAVLAGSAAACAIALHTAVNLRFLRTPSSDAPSLDESVTVLIPARDEEAHIETTVRSVLAQDGVPGLSVIVLDDGSTDGTAVILDRLAESDARLSVVHAPDAPPPAGWLGKPWACMRLADQAVGSVLVFVDADVELRSVVTTMRQGGFTLVAPYPFQESQGWLERLVQPLVTWSWAALVPLRWAESSARPSLSAANGQFIAVDADAYRAIDGHGSVRADVIEDVALMRAMKSSGRHTATVDGSTIATCRMYDGANAVVDGYAKSLWSAFNGPIGSIAVNTLLVGIYVVPAVAAITARDSRTRRIGLLGYAAGVASRTLVARRTGERALPDALLQPASIAAFTALNVISWQRHVRGSNTWKGRAVVAG
ncbi:MAG: glycosyltransferase family 2 protein [Actinobacteria bacterium]|nr:glycosyltransferase family 2 protein [Actinomycetota bacterium]